MALFTLVLDAFKTPLTYIFDAVDFFLVATICIQPEFALIIDPVLSFQLSSL